MAEEEVFAAAQLRTPLRPLTLRRVPAGFRPSTQCRCATSALGPCQCATSAGGSIIRDNALPHLECVRIGRLGFASLRFIEIGQRLPVRVHTLRQPSDNLIRVIVSGGLLITEIQPAQACGTSEIPEATFGTETISGTQTIFGMETIAFVATGKNTFSRGARGIGTAIGIVAATTGGMATSAPSSTERG